MIEASAGDRTLNFLANQSLLTPTSSGTLKKGILGICFELIPERKSSTLIGSVLIDCTLAFYWVKKAADMLTIDKLLLKGKPALNLTDILCGK